LPDLWKWTLASGLLAVILGILVLAWPGISILVAATLFRRVPVGEHAVAALSSTCTTRLRTSRPSLTCTRRCAAPA
jgi:hypothetical protein